MRLQGCAHGSHHTAAVTMRQISYRCLLQAYVPLMKDMRYITTYGGPEGLQACSTFARRFSLRYTHSQDSGLAATPQVRHVQRCQRQALQEDTLWCHQGSVFAALNTTTTQA